MTPSLFDLPLRLGDAAALAAILFEQLGTKPVPVRPEQRIRIAARAEAIAFDAMRVWFGSLERDPVHPSAYYICVDGVEGQPLLLRVATVSTPSSGLFPRSILIGRTFVARTEAVFNVVPFGPAHREQLHTFATEVNPAFEPRVLSNRKPVRVTGDVTAAIGEQVRRWRAGEREQLLFNAPEGEDSAAFTAATLWAVIRGGWREGYAIQ